MSGPTVLITGGSRGLGLSTARHMARAGWNIALTDISERACRVYGEAGSVAQIIRELEAHGVVARFYAASLTMEDQVGRMVEAVETDFGAIDGLVAMAGGDVAGFDDEAAGGKPAENTAFAEYRDFQAVFDRNFLTCVLTCRAVARKMVPRERGKILTVASTSAGYGVVRETSYAVAKAGVVHFTRCLAAQLRPCGINVNCIAPGATNTGRFRATLKGRTAEDLARWKAAGRLERLAEPEDVCKVIEFFLQPASDFVSGQVLRVDGGQFTSPL